MEPMLWFGLACANAGFSLALLLFTLARAAELRRERRERDAGGKRGDGEA